MNAHATTKRAGRRWTDYVLLLALGLALATLAGVSAKKGTSQDSVSTTTPPTPITGATTVEYALRVEVTKAMNLVSAAGRFVPLLSDLAIPGASVRLNEDIDGDGYDDDGKLEMSRAGVTLCMTLPSETGARYLGISDGSCA